MVFREVLIASLLGGSERASPTPHTLSVTASIGKCSALKTTLEDECDNDVASWEIGAWIYKNLGSQDVEVHQNSNSFNIQVHLPKSNYPKVHQTSIE
jgi:hypothetical protein